MKIILPFVIFLSALLLLNCGPAGDKEDSMSNHPLIPNDNYYERDGDEDAHPSTNPAFTREDDTTKKMIDDRNREDEMEGKK